MFYEENLLRMSNRLLKGEPKHVGVINLRLNPSCMLLDGDSIREAEPKQWIRIHLGYRFWKFEVNSINRAPTTELLLVYLSVCATHSNTQRIYNVLKISVSFLSSVFQCLMCPFISM